MTIETAQSHVQKGLFIKQVMENVQLLNEKQIEKVFPTGDLALEGVNKPTSIKGHLLKGLVIQNS